jgi:hypothetical protein
MSYQIKFQEQKLTLISSGTSAQILEAACIRNISFFGICLATLWVIKSAALLEGAQARMCALGMHRKT